MKPVRLIKRKRRVYADSGVATPMGANEAMVQKTELSPEEYQQKIMEAYDKYGTDVALAFDPNSQTFSPGNVWLDAAEVTADFVPNTKEERDAYNNLGVEGALQMRDMQRGITEARNKFAEDYMVPAAEVALHASGAGTGLQGLNYGLKAARAARFAAPLAKQFAKQAGKKLLKLGGKKLVEKGIKMA